MAKRIKDTDYLPVSGRIRAMENSLLTKSRMEQLLEARTEEELEKVRQQGFAVEDGEYRVGLRSVAAPIFSVEGEVRWAIGIVGMFRRVSSEDFQQARGLVCRAAERISYDMGYRGQGL